MDKLIHCSFCGKSQEEVNKIVSGDDVTICNECIYRCVGILIGMVKPKEGDA